MLIFTLDGRLVCYRGTKSTIQPLNLLPVTKKKCKPSETCGVATIKVQYQNVTGQGKIGGCVRKIVCSSAAGCLVANQFLPAGAKSLKCKVLYINIYLPSFCSFFFVLIFYMNSCSDLNYNLITNTWKNRHTRNDKRCAAGLNSTIKNTKTVIMILFWSLL